MPFVVNCVEWQSGPSTTPSTTTTNNNNTQFSRMSSFVFCSCGGFHLPASSLLRSNSLRIKSKPIRKRTLMSVYWCVCVCKDQISDNQRCIHRLIGFSILLSSIMRKDDTHLAIRYRLLFNALHRPTISPTPTLSFSFYKQLSLHLQEIQIEIEQQTHFAGN